MESSLPPLHPTRIHLTHTIKHIDLRWGDDLRVDPLTEDLAVVASSYEETRTDTEGHRAAESGFFFTAVAEYRNGLWQFQNAHWSVSVPPREGSLPRTASASSSRTSQASQMQRLLWWKTGTRS